MKCLIGSLIGLVLSVGVGAEPLLEGRVRLPSGQPVAGVQVRLFDLTDLRQFISTTTDASGHFALQLRAFSTDRGTALPTDFALGQNYPNPFNPSTIIPYRLPTAAHVRLEVFNMLGQRLATLVDAEQSAGVHTAQWDATDAAGRAVGAGVYIYRLSSGGMTESRRMVLVDGQAGIPAAGAAPGVVRSAVKDLVEADGSVYGLTVSGKGLMPYVNPAFRVGVDEADIVIKEHGGARMKLTADGVLGDVNGNGFVDMIDALFVAMYSVDPSSLAVHIPNIALGDVDADGDIDFTDAYLIGLFIVDPFDPALPPGIGQDLDSTLVGATEVSLGSSTTGSLSERDTDYFRVTMSSAGTLTAYTTSNTDTKGYILDSFGNVLSDDDDGGEGLNFQVSASVSAGTYYIRVAGFSWTAGDYTLHVVGPLDLVVAASVNDSTLAFGQPFTLRATVRNQGGGESDPTVLFYYSSTDATISSDDTQFRADAVSLDASDTITKSIPLTAPEEAGTYYYGVCIQSVSGEHNPDNNCSDAVRVTVSSDFVYTLPPPPPPSSRMYWTDKEAGTIQRANLDGTNIETLVTGTGLFPSPFGIALDVAGGKMYWTDYIQDDIRRANLDGTNIETLVTGLDWPAGLALVLDVAGGKMYWTISPALSDGEGTIQRANLDGTNIETLVTGLDEPTGLVLDVARGKIYWTNSSIFSDGQGSIRRANLDGTNIETLVTVTGVFPSPFGIALDVAGGKMYWTDQIQGDIRRANLDGTNIETLVTGLDWPTGLALDVAGGKMYWTISPVFSDGQGSIRRANLDGTNIETLVTGLDEPIGIALGP